MRTSLSPPGRRAAVASALAAVGLLALTAVAPGVDANRQHRGAKAVRVQIQGFAYKPKAVRVRRGTKVVFVNRDGAPHTATRRGSFDTGVLRKGNAQAVRFKRRGAYRYICTIHPSMRGRIVVR